MNRRSAGFAAVAGVAALTGAGSAWWRARAVGDAPPVAPDFWSLAFQNLEGSSLRMADWRGRPLLLNFWATWCVPCVTEMPLLDRFSHERSTSGWRVLALAIDQADPVRRFIAERSLRLPIALAGSDGIDLSRDLGNTVGALPFSVVFASSGDPVDRKLGAVTPALLSEWANRTR